jgi:hypothetical protein
MAIEINDLHKFGVIKDVPAYQLPPEAFSLIEGMRMTDRGIARMKGWEQIFGTPGVAPYFAMPVATAAQVFWLYLGLQKAYVFDGTSHTNITRQSAGVDVNYTHQSAAEINGTMLGSIPIINNGTDIPQYWPSPTIATKLANLSNWPANYKAKVIRALGSFLIAGGITTATENRPHRILWSHPADPGTIPVSWDVADTTRDAGDKELADTESGVIQELRPLQGQMYVYKGTSTWRGRFVGGREIFDFSTFLDTSGALAPRCVTTTSDGKRHVVLTQDDLIWHNGNQVESILDEKARQALFDEIDTNNFGSSFLFPNPAFKEVWVCYPGAGQVVPNRALIWNEKYNAITEWDIDFQWATTGEVEAPSEEDWEATEEDWEVDSGPWSEILRRKVILCNPVNTKFHMLDKGLTKDGVAFAGTLQREGLSVLGRKRSGEWIVDHQSFKHLQRLWPKIQGGPIRVRTGVQTVVDGPVTWGAYKTFNPATDVFVDGNLASGRANAIEYSTTDSVDWRIDGYKAEISQEGEF